MSLPNISAEYIDKVFSALGSMEVLLDENPLDYGPRRLNNKVAEARRMLSDTENIFLSVSKAIQKYRSAHRSAQTQLNLEKKSLMANDPETRAGRNLATQDAIASMKLRGQVEEVEVLQATLEDLDTLITVIKSKRSDLKDIQGRIRDQIKLCQEEIGLGSRWGSKPPPGSNAPSLDDAPKPDGKSLRELRDMFEGVSLGGENLNEVLVGDEKPPSEDDAALNSFFDGGPTDQSSDDFLEAIETEAPQKTAIDLDEVLSGFDVQI